MSETTATGGHTEHDLWSVFREQEETTERSIYRWALIVSASCILLPAFSTFVLRRPLGANALFFVLPIAGATWFAIAYSLRRYSKLAPALRVGTVLFFSLVPWVIMLSYVVRFNFERALGTWEPLMFFTAPTVLSILWRRPWVPLMMAGVGTACYVALYVFNVPPDTWSSIPADSPLKPGVTIYRSSVLLFTGGLCFLGARIFQRALLRGARALRARELFGKYRLQEPIGHGGMGSVVKALYCPEGGFQRPVAIKRVLASLATHASTIQQFRAEAELGSRLVHPNIVAVLDFGRVDETYFFAMEYVDGHSLAEVFAMAESARLALPTAFVARVGCDICAALRYAHHEAVDGEGVPLRVVHRDLSPHNVLVARSGQTKITDFGIARSLGHDDAQQTSKVVGKLAYMAPEAVLAQPFDTRADIFSFGVILWEMLTGERLFERNHTAAVALAAAEARVDPPSSRRPDLDPMWDEICKKALEKDVDRRFHNVTELHALLLDRLAEEGEAEGDEVRLTLRVLEQRSEEAD